MKNHKYLTQGMFTALIFACLQAAALGQEASQGVKEIKLANISARGSSVRWEVVAQHSGGTLTVSAPDGQVFRKEFRVGTSPEFTLSDKDGNKLPDGQYSYELRLTPVLGPGVREELAASRAQGNDDAAVEREMRKRGLLPSQPLVESGAFTILNGTVIVAGIIEEPRPATKPTGQQRSPAVPSGNTLNRLRHHRLALGAIPDQVIPDDLIVQGSACVGLDCVDNESFGFDTIRLKENNTRIKFDDTSTAAGFPANDWQLTANDSASGGSSKFSIEDITGAKVPFTITAGAATNSIFVDSTGRLGLGTSTPVLDIHANTSNTPAIRLEQNSSGGFSAQTWDVAGNEANFFVRDVTGGSRLPFRIRPGAPTSSIDIAASGNVGIGTAAPTSLLHLSSALTSGTNLRIQSTDTGGHSFTLKATGSASAAGVGKFAVIDNTTGATPFVIDSSGNIGIATTAPTDTLSVNGTASKPGGGSWAVFSDERLKTINGRFNSGLKALMQLQPIRYEYKRNNALGLKAEGENVGFGAQAVQKIIPEAVTRNENGYLQVNNDPILWTMLNAIKEQQKEISELKGQIRRLQAASRRRRK